MNNNMINRSFYVCPRCFGYAIIDQHAIYSNMEFDAKCKRCKCKSIKTNSFIGAPYIDILAEECGITIYEYSKYCNGPVGVISSKIDRYPNIIFKVTDGNFKYLRECVINAKEYNKYFGGSISVYDGDEYLIIRSDLPMTECLSIDGEIERHAGILREFMDGVIHDFIKVIRELQNN